MGLNSAQGHTGLTGLGPAPDPRELGVASARMTRSHHARPWPERAWWRAHHRLNDGEDLEQTEGKRSLDFGRHATTRKPRRGGQEGGRGGAPLRHGARCRVIGVGEQSEKATTG
jgi:hypothetical protein